MLKKLYILSLIELCACGSLYARQKPSDTIVWDDESLGLETVVVTATRTPKTLKDIPIVTHVITAEDIQKVDATNVKDMLQQELPGLEFTYSMGQQVLNMGGYDGNNILFLIDGERMAGESMDNIDFSRIDLSCVERIEIVKGAASTLYGSSAMGGVINIITKEPSSNWTAKINTRYEGATKEWRHGANLDFNISKVNSLTTFQMTDADALQLGEESSLPTYGSKSYNAKERLVWNVSDVFKLTGRAGFFFRERESGTVSHERYRDFNDGIKANWVINSFQNLEVAYNFDQYDKSDLNLLTNKDIRDYSNRQNIGRVLYNLQMPSWKSQLTAGADYMNDYLMTYQFSDDDKDRSQNSYDAFVQYDYTPSDHWNLIGGVRYDYFSAADMGKPTWKIASMYKTGKHQFRASYASGFRAPSLKELYMDFFMGGIFMIYGNPDLKCETNHNFSLSWTNYGSLGSNLKYCLTTAGYYNFFYNYIATATIQRDGKTGQMYTNIADQQIAGVNVTAQLHHHYGMEAKVSYAFTKNVVKKGQPDLTAARPHSLTWRASYDHQFTPNYGFNVALSGRFLSAVDIMEYTSSTLEDITRTHYDGYSLWKISLSQRFIKGITINCAVDNIFNYKPKNYYANSPVTLGTTITAGLSIDIDKFF